MRSPLIDFHVKISVHTHHIRRISSRNGILEKYQETVTSRSIGTTTQYPGSMQDEWLMLLNVTIPWSFSADGTDICAHHLLEGKNQRSKKNEHFEGLLKKILDEPCTGSKKKKRKEQAGTCDNYPVQQRALCAYDVLCNKEEQ